jgi:hypothetical protein
MYSRIQAERLEADRVRASRVAEEHLKEDSMQAKLIADERLKTDLRLEAEGLVAFHVVLAAERRRVDMQKAKLVASEREKAAGIESDRIAAERLAEDMKLELADADHLLEADAEANRVLEADVEADRLLGRLEADHAPIVRKRLHRRTEDTPEGKKLLDEMKRVITECFEEKKGARVKSCDFFRVFARSTVLSEFDPNIFKQHSKKLFLAHWTRSRASMFRNERCFVDMAAK